MTAQLTSTHAPASVFRSTSAGRQRLAGGASQARRPNANHPRQLSKRGAAPVMSSLKTPSSTEMPLASAPAAKPASSKIWLA